MKGIAELLLSVAVLGAAWTRTPAGAMVRSVVAHAQDQPTEDLLASFRAGLSEELDASLSRALVSVPTAVSADDAGLHTAIEASLGTEVSARIRDQVAAGKDAEAALEQHAVGTDARTRAIRRARSAGVTSPQRYAAHRRFLPDRLQRKADREVGDVLALATVLDMAWPVSADARVTSPFGKRVHPVLGTHKMHDGVDIAVPTGTPVHATGAGKVRSAREAKVSGRYVVIDHGHGVSSNYCHADVLHVAKGDAVRAGQHILDSGNTGRSTGPHLHFGLRLHGRAIDPGRLRRPTSTSP